MLSCFTWLFTGVPLAGYDINSLSFLIYSSVAVLGSAIQAEVALSIELRHDIKAYPIGDAFEYFPESLEANSRDWGCTGGATPAAFRVALLHHVEAAGGFRTGDVKDTVSSFSRPSFRDPLDARSSRKFADRRPCA